MTDNSIAARPAPYMLSVLRIVVALLFLEHGLSRLFGWPSALPTPPLTLYWFAGAIELCRRAAVRAWPVHAAGGVLDVGRDGGRLFSQPAPRNFFPILNGGDSAILYCFIFLYFAFAVPGRGASTRSWDPRARAGCRRPNSFRPQGDWRDRLRPAHHLAVVPREDRAQQRRSGACGTMSIDIGEPARHSPRRQLDRREPHVATGVDHRRRRRHRPRICAAFTARAPRFSSAISTTRRLRRSPRKSPASSPAAATWQAAPRSSAWCQRL